ncbi:MAG: GNAT family N-acetyltransferase [Coprococcus sp.]
MFLDSDEVLYAGLTEIIKRGTAEIFEENEKGVFLRDKIGGAFMLASDDLDTAVEWLKKHENCNYDLLVVFQRELIAFIRGRYGLSGGLDCLQAAYLSSDPPDISRKLRIEHALDSDLGVLTAFYKTVDEADLKKIIRRGELFVGYHGKDMVGFVGQHLEGSMGILEILPQYQGNGYGTEMEIFMIRHMLEKGLLPFCQVVVGNEKSMGLQKKLGLTFSEGHMFWLF